MIQFDNIPNTQFSLTEHKVSCHKQLFSVNDRIVRGRINCHV